MTKVSLQAWLAVVVWMGLIFYLSSFSMLPGPDLILSDFLFKKMAHMFVYAVLWFLVQRAILLSWTKKSSRSTLIVFMICILYAISDEFHQSMTPGRHPSIIDVGYDTLGMYMMYLKSNTFI